MLVFPKHLKMAEPEVVFDHAEKTEAILLMFKSGARLVHKSTYKLPNDVLPKQQIIPEATDSINPETL